MSGYSRITLALAIAAGLAIWLAGCCTLGVSKCTVTDVITFAAAAELNACDEDDQSHAVAVRIYGLKDGQKFVGSSVDALWNDAKGALGSDLVGDPIELYVAPSDGKAREIVREAGVQALGIVVNFCREREDGCRKLVVPVGKKGEKATVSLKRDCASIKEP